MWRRLESPACCPPPTPPHQEAESRLREISRDTGSAFVSHGSHGWRCSHAPTGLAAATATVRSASRCAAEPAAEPAAAPLLAGDFTRARQLRRGLGIPKAPLATALGCGAYATITPEEGGGPTSWMSAVCTQPMGLGREAPCSLRPSDGRALEPCGALGDGLCRSL